MTPAERQEAWRSLDATDPPLSGEFRVFESDVRVADGPILFAVDSDGLRHLFVPVAAGTAVVPDRRSRGVHLLPRSLEEQREMHYFVDISCRKRELNPVFDQLVGDMLSAMSDQQSTAEASCRIVLSRWRSLLDREPSRRLGLSELVGLFGELQCVKRLANTTHSLRAWVGPHGNRHDFVGRGVSLEVKTTLSGAGRIAEIHGVDQLEPPEGSELFLGWLLVERNDFTGASIPELVAGLLEAGVDRVELLSKLLAVGYDVRDADDYSDVRLRVSEQRYYRVDDSFPRIVRGSFVTGDLPARTGALTYAIDLAGGEPSPLDNSREEELFACLSGRE